MMETYPGRGLGKGSWSANEESCITGVPLKQVHRLIDAGLLGDSAEYRNGVRVVLGAGLIALKLVYELGTVLTAEGRRPLIRRLIDDPAVGIVHEETLSVDLQLMAEAVRRRIAFLEEAKQMAETDEGVLGGTPCFKGTRIPIHDIAAMLANGDSVAALQAAYPRLTEAQISAAPIYARTCPRRGRRRKTQRWRQRQSSSSKPTGSPT